MNARVNTLRAKQAPDLAGEPFNLGLPKQIGEIPFTSLPDQAQIAIDRWNATQLATQLSGDGFQIVALGQGTLA